MIVVTGATGNVGRVLVEALASAGERVNAVSRGTPPIALPEGVVHHRADLTEPETLRPAVDGADAMFLMVSGAGAHVPAAEVVDVAKAGGVRHLVLLSSQAAATRPESASHAPLRAIEEVVRQSGLDWTILRPGGFASNAYAWSESVRTQWTVTAPYGDVGLPVVDPADIAEVAAAALRDSSHAGHHYDLTGPALTTPRERVALIGEALGHPIRFVEQTPAQARTQMLQFMPEPVVDGTLAIIGHPTPAEQQVSPDIERLLARPPHTFTHWLQQHLPAFR